VQLIKAKNLIITFLACFCVLWIGSCSDNPQNQAAKAVRQKTQEALDIVNSIGVLEVDSDGVLKASLQEQRAKAIEFYTQARAKVKSALAEGKRAGINVDPTLLVNANLTFEQASQMWSSLRAGSKPMVDYVESIADRLHDVTDLLIEQDRLKSLLDAIDVEIEQITANIAGDGDNVGLEKQLAQKNAQIDELQKRLDNLAAQLEQAENAEREIQQRAQAKFRQSESATGSEKMKLEQQAYEILQTRKEVVLRNMALVDKMEGVQDQIDAIAPLAEKIESNLKTALERLDAAENSARRNLLKQQLADVNGAIPQSQQQIGKLVIDLKDAQKMYAESFDEITALMDEACGDYKKVRSEGSATAAKARLADCYSQAAVMCMDAMFFNDGISLRLESMATFVEGANVLGGAASEFAQIGAGYADKAVERYDEAIKAYDSLNKMGRRVGEEFACDVAKNYLLALYGRVSLAERLGDNDTADTLLTKVDELVEAADKFGSAFNKSATARIISGEMDYIPVLSVDNTAYYEEFRKQFLSWPRLPVAEREAEANRLLALAIEKKAEIADEEFDKIIDPEIKKLEDAIEKGFKEEEKPRRAVSTDPNNM
jgi:uncharacterized protein YukE